MAYLNVTNAPAATFFARVGTAIGALTDRYKQHRLYRETYSELSNLTNRELDDLGLHRADLDRVAREATWG
ncbi:DUF1127 domain-containing protein [Sulfitobacter aestuariivivens]|uniref:DUF1127 domain-containing protein n=1 Tax=Sulfitobacter aestuariivivens TaxID=2766981 RepID=A0A927HDG7_9RHOB|nr:DUF1127 domain-containing protein [Sulfitobacter aestuariivivens]MBD3663667.1 DUF1127 domain-containing protein [Sulfitobacter aestuariivivens]